MADIHEIIAFRRSTVLFSNREINEESIQTLFEAARRAPSSMNQQPWRFVYVVKNDRSFHEWLHCLSEKNREWAKNASMLVLTVAQIISDYNNIIPYSFSQLTKFKILSALIKIQGTDK